MLTSVLGRLEGTIGKDLVALKWAVTRLKKKKVKGSRTAQQTCFMGKGRCTSGIRIGMHMTRTTTWHAAA